LVAALALVILLVGAIGLGAWITRGSRKPKWTSAGFTLALWKMSRASTRCAAIPDSMNCSSLVERDPEKWPYSQRR
jgi:hypothetical protein